MSTLGLNTPRAYIHAVKELSHRYIQNLPIPKPMIFISSYFMCICIIHIFESIKVNLFTLDNELILSNNGANSTTS